MSPSCYITVRTTKSGKRWVVRYRVGGRYSKLVHAGSFKTQKAARDRRDFVISELAAGRDPRATLAALDQTRPARTYREWAAAYKASRIDQADVTIYNLDHRIERFADLFDNRDPHTLTVAEQLEAVAKLTAALAPATVKAYWGTHRKILDFAEVTPNPAKDPKVKLPRLVQEEAEPPSAEHFLALLDHLAERRRLPVVLIEQTGMTIGEVETLAWGDVDERGHRLRLRRRNVKAQIAARTRWVQVPEWLMGFVSATCPVEDRVPERLVFPGVTGSSVKSAMARACRTAGIPVYSPHDLRHRRASLWHGQGVPARELSARIGHTKTSITLDVYSHVMPLDEVPVESLERLLVRSR